MPDRTEGLSEAVERLRVVAAVFVKAKNGEAFPWANADDAQQLGHDMQRVLDVFVARTNYANRLADRLECWNIWTVGGLVVEAVEFLRGLPSSLPAGHAALTPEAGHGE